MKHRDREEKRVVPGPALAREAAEEMRALRALIEESPIDAAELE
jgi:hypothetical protein